MKEVIRFLTELHRNNERSWFEAHKAEYKHALARFEAFAVQLIEGIAAFDPSVAGLTLKDCTYRIYRDTRFSHDKTPYKTHMGVYVAPHGKKAGYSGYYFHVQPESVGDDWAQGSLMSTGLYMPAPEVLRSVREEIVDNGAAIAAAIGEAKGFTLDESSKLKRPPKDFPAGTPYDELLKLRDLYVLQRLTPEFIAAPGLLENTLQEFRKTKRLNDLFNRAAQLAISGR